MSDTYTEGSIPLYVDRKEQTLYSMMLGEKVKCCGTIRIKGVGNTPHFGVFGQDNSYLIEKLHDKLLKLTATQAVYEKIVLANRK